MRFHRGLRSLGLISLPAVLCAVLLVAGTNLAASASAARSGAIVRVPAGWVPVVHGDAQISIPASWWVGYHSPPCLPVTVAGESGETGEVFVDPLQGAFHCPESTGSISNTTVTLQAPRSSVTSGHPTYVNGLAAYPYPAGPATSYLVPALDLEISIAGPLGRPVLGTLTTSPRDAVPSSVAGPGPPSSWRAVRFAGLSFSAPVTWPILRTSEAPVLGALCGTRGVAFAASAVTLSTDRKPMAPAKCPTVLTTPQLPTDGVQVDSGPSSPASSLATFATKCLRIGRLTACPATSPAYSILVLKLTAPSLSAPVVVALGLSGTGVVASTILHSFRA